MSAIAEIEKRVLALPLKDRAFLAESLLRSLPPLGEDSTEANDMAEAERREKEVENGEAQPMTDAEFWQNIEAGGHR